MAAESRLAITTLVSFTTWGNTIQRSLNPANYGTTVTAYLEVHAKTSSASAAFQAQLKNVTLSETVGGSSVSTTSTRTVCSPRCFT